MFRSGTLWCVAPLFVAALAAQVSFATVAKGDVSGQHTARQVSIRTPAEWQALWNDHSPSGKTPGVDFKTKMVVGVFLGSKPSGGHAVEIIGVRTQEKDLIIEYIQKQPGPGTMSAQILTEPYHLVAVAKHAGPVRFLHVPDTRP
jgi:hypothetical protein